MKFDSKLNPDKSEQKMFGEFTTDSNPTTSPELSRRHSSIAQRSESESVKPSAKGHDDDIECIPNSRTTKKFKAEYSDQKFYSKSLLGRCRPKSRSGCLTCKYRRKKCDETRPVCKDCHRFGKECVWVDLNTMTFDDVRKLKEKVKERESASKLRIRLRSSKLEQVEDDQKKHPITVKVKNEPEEVVSTELTTQTILSSLSENTIIHQQESGVLLDDSLGLVPVKFNDDVDLKIEPPMMNFPLNTPFNNTMFTNLQGTVPTDVDHYNPYLQTGADIQFGHSDEEDIQSSAFLSFLREAARFANGSLDKLTLLNLDKLTQINLENQDNGDCASSIDQTRQISTLPGREQHYGFNIYDFLEQVLPLSHDCPSQFSLLASSFNATFTTSPQPSLSEVPELDAKGLFLYNYYLETLSKKVSIAPISQNESNSYQRVFLPLAQQDKGVLFAILAWSGFHLGGKYMKEGSKYAEKAVKNLLRDVNFNENSHIEDRRTIVHKLATILILCGAEICRGDVKIWSVYLDWGWRLLRDNGGILNFDTNKEEHWLISNFAYHDLLAVSERPQYFPNETYDQIFKDPNENSKGNLNPLLGVSKALYKVIGAINQFAYESRTPMRNYYGKRCLSLFKSHALSPTESVSSEGSDQSTASSHTAALNCLHASLAKARELDHYIETCRPDIGDLVNLSDRDLELQLTTFEAFQISCKLHLRQSILKLNPSALECQILVHHLTKCIDILIGTPMQATLVFPIFIAGLYMVTDDDKEAMKRRFELMMKLYGPWNVVRAKYVVEKVWELNPQGDRWSDWGLILSDLGWELNFA